MSLERFINDGEIEIPRDPISNMRRLAVLQNGQWWNPVFKQAALNYDVHYLNEAGERLTGERFRPYRWALVADERTKVDEQFNVIPDPGPAPKEILNEEQEVTNQAEIDTHNAALAVYQAAKTEYKALLDMVNANINFFQIQYNMTLLRAQQGKANK